MILGNHMMNPASLMRSGGIPGIMPSGRNLRSGITSASARVHAGYPYQTAPLPAPLPVASPASVAVPGMAPGGTAGAFGGVGFGSHGGVRFDPYSIMRSGGIPGVFPSGANIRAGITHASQRVHGSYPYQTAPLPAPLPVASPASVPVPGVTATGTKGLMGVLADHLGIPRRRGGGFFRSFFRHPAAVAAASSSCEKLGPRSDGLYVTVCNGQVTEYSDAAGNVHPNPYTNPGAY
jgi:hypothetical protein